jgi:hypothetical protein
VYTSTLGAREEGQVLVDLLLYILNPPEGAHTAHTQVGRPTHEAPTREYTHKHPQTQTNTQSTLYHGLRCSRPSPIIAEKATTVRVHVRRRVVEALRAVVLAHARSREETLLLLVLLQFVELVVRLGQPLDVPLTSHVPQP